MNFYKTVIRADASDGITVRESCIEQKGGERKYRYHRHTEFELALIKSGSGRYRIREKEYNFAAGDIFIMSSNEYHCITYMNSTEDFHLMNIHFEPRYIWAADNYGLNPNFLKIFFERNEIFENRLNRSNCATDIIKGLMLEMETEAREKNIEYELMIKLALIKILVTIVRNFDYVKHSSINFDIGRTNIESLENAMNHIKQNLENKITLNDLAKAANMNRSYFCTVFKKLNGISAWDYITIKRIEKSVVLLETTDKTMLEIACRCGFNNTANFNRAFRKVTGKVPGEYRKHR